MHDGVTWVQTTAFGCLGSKPGCLLAVRILAGSDLIRTPPKPPPYVLARSAPPLEAYLTTPTASRRL